VRIVVALPRTTNSMKATANLLRIKIPLMTDYTVTPITFASAFCSRPAPETARICRRWRTRLNFWRHDSSRRIDKRIALVHVESRLSIPWSSPSFHHPHRARGRGKYPSNRCILPRRVAITGQSH